MGRVDEAMRRAAAGTVVAPPVPEYDVEALAAEPFPEETPAAEPPSAPAMERHEGAGGDAVNGRPLAPAPKQTGSFVFEGSPVSLSGKGVTDAEMQPASREQYRKLAAGLHAAQRASGLKVVMIASAVASEGKTLTASNLALTMSESYRRSVLLIDGDLRRPSIHGLFHLESNPGLTDCLNSVEERRLPLHRVTERLTILTAGRPNSDPMAGLTSDRMRQLIGEAREVFDWVIVDTPPVGLLTDANLLSAMTDAAILVVKADTTPYYLVQRAINAITKDHLLGLVLNQATLTTPAYGYSYYNAYYGQDLSKANGK